MDCERLVAIVRRWGYDVAHRYLIDVYGLPPREVDECTKGIGIDLGRWSLLYASPLGKADAVHRLWPPPRQM
jgi:hypothetical protein